MDLRYDLLLHGVQLIGAARDGELAGLTVHRACQLAEDLVLVGLGDQSHTRRLVEASGAFGVSVLDVDQISLAWRFGNFTSAELNKWEGLDWLTLETGAPIFRGGLLGLDCRVEETVYVGSARTRLFIGRIVAATVFRHDKEPLPFFQDDYL